MAHQQQLPLPSSTVIRQQIGRVRQLIINYNNKYNEAIDQISIDKLSSQELSELVKVIDHLHAKLNDAFGSLQKYHVEWQNLMRIYPNEHGIYEEYVGTYGEYIQYFTDIPKITKEMKENIDLIYLRIDELGNGVNPMKGRILQPQKGSNPDPRINAQPHDGGIPEERRIIPPQNGGNPETRRIAQPHEYHAANDDDTLKDLIDPFYAMKLSPVQPAVQVQAEARLPKIDITPFEGDPTLWYEFIEQFTELIDSKHYLGKVTKFTYLRNLLKGKARTMISGLPLSEKNYDIAIAILKDCFGGTKEIATRLRDELMDLPDCTQMDFTLVDFYYNVLRIYRQLTELGLKPDNYDIAHIIEKKLPRKAIAIIYSGCKDNKNMSTQDILSKLENVIKEIVLVDVIARKKRPTSSHHTMYSMSKPIRDECLLCFSTDHRARRCHRYPTPDDKYFRCRSLRRCIRCMRKHHKSECKSRERCYHCGHDHNSMFCKRGDDDRGRSRDNRGPDDNRGRGRSSHKRDLTPYRQPSNERNNYKKNDYQREYHDKRTNTYNKNYTDSRTKPDYQKRRSDSRDSRDSRQSSRHSSLDSRNGRNGRSNSQEKYSKEKYDNGKKYGVKFDKNKGKHSRGDSRERKERVNYVEVEPYTTDEEELNDSDDDDESRHYVYGVSTELTNRSKYDHDESSSSETILMSLSLQLISSDGSIHSAIGMVDPGSTGNFISSSLIERLGIPPLQEDELHLAVFGTKKIKSVMSDRYMVDLLLINNTTMPLEMNSLNVLTSPLKIIKMSESDLDYVRENSVVNLPLCKQKPDVLLSTATYASLLTPDSPVEILPSGFRIQHSLAGPILFGNGKIDRECLRDMKTILMTQNNDPKIEECLKKLWETEAIGITDKPTDCEDEESLQYFEKTVRFENGRYTVKFHWRNGMTVGLNYDQSYARLCHAFKTLKKNNLIDKYHSIIIEQLNKNIIEVVPPGQIDGEPGKRTHIPHHPIITPERSTKTRIVYDGSSTTETGNSLNQCLFRGPVILPDIGGIILRCRQPFILISSDVEKAFLQIELDIPDRDATLFLWLKDPNLPPTKENVVTYRFRRVPFGIISSPFHLSAVIRHHLIKMNHPLLKNIHDNAYVDNIFLFADSSEEAEELYKLSKQAFADGGMNLREYASNDISFNKFVIENNEAEIPAEVKVLGLKWHLQSDTFITKFSPSPIPDNQVWTKRKILKYSAKPFDIIGLLAPIIIVLKMFLQGLWKKIYRWDQPLDKSDEKEFLAIIATMRPFTMSIPRCLFRRTDHDPTLELHTFVDASSKAYACVSYLRIFSPSNGYTVRFLFAKSRLVPISGITIPKGELLAIKIGTRIQRYIRNSLKDLKIKRSIIWSDSKVALMWTLSDTTTNIFVKNRCRKINETMKEHDNTSLFYISTDINPADIASRGSTIDELEQYHQWIEGPDFLKLPDNQWNDQSQLSAIEMKKREQNPDQSLSVNAVMSDDSHDEHQAFPVNFTNYNSYYEVIGVVARVIYFFKFACQPFFMKLMNIRDKAELPVRFSDIQVQLMKVAERIVIKRIQKEIPPPKHVPNKAEFIIDQNGIVRVKSRIPNANSNIPKFRDPIYLPHTHHITKLIIMYIHTISKHCSPLHVLAALRSHYWLIKGRSIVKQVIKNMCTVCRRFTAKPFKLPNMKILPNERIATHVAPFSNIGLDYAGPFNIKSTTGQLEKIWVVLVTCLSVRAVHCEYVKDLKAQTFLNFLRRFISRRGHVQFIYCDNQSTFVASQKVLAEIHNQSSELNAFCRKRKIVFQFITALSPWKGGCYERLVGLVKKCLKTTIGRKLVSEEEFHTYLYESEAVINSRPITYVSGDVNEIVPLRPIDFIIPFGNIDTSHFDDYENDYIAHKTPTTDLVALWKEQTKRLDYFWNVFYNHYVTDLLYSSENVHKQGKYLNSHKPKKGDVVIVKNDNPNRSHWELARIIDLPDTLEPSTATIKSSNGNILNRPISMLHYMESSEWDAKDDKNSKDLKEIIGSENTDNNHHPMKTRSKTKSISNLALITLVMMSIFPFASSNVIHPIHTNVNATNHDHDSASSPFACPFTLSNSSEVIFSTHCLNRGLILIRNNNSICYRATDCGSSNICKHTDIKSENIHDQRFSCCHNMTCKCPQWAKHCSQTLRPSIFKLTENEKLMIKHIVRESSQICAVHDIKEIANLKNNHLPSCSKQLTTDTFTRIQLFDESTFHIHSNNFRLKIQDFESGENSLTCVDTSRHSSLLPYTPKSFIGTAAVCRQFPCSNTSENFCMFYDSIPRIYLTEEGLSFPIRSWGEVNVTYYKYQITDNTPPLFDIVCSTNGIKLNVSHKYTSFTFCIDTYCINLHELPDQKVINFPLDLMHVAYSVTSSAYINNSVITSKMINCKGAPICTLILCTFCSLYFRNPQCWSSQSYIGFLLLAFICLLIPVIFIKLIVTHLLELITKLIIWKIVYVIKLSIRLICTLFRKGINLIMCKARQRIFLKRDRILLTIIITLFVQIEGCDKVSSISASQNHCRIDPKSGYKTCSFDQTTLLNFSPGNQDLCMSFHDSNNTIIGNIIIKPIHFVSTCRKKSEYYTRDHEIVYETVTRCPWTSGCKGSSCSSINLNSSIPDLSNAANNAPGYSFCEDGRGCAHDGCGWCFKPSCRYYRYYVKPTTNTIYEVFSCSVWDTYLHLQINVETYNETSPSGMVTWNDSITIGSVKDYVSTDKRMTIGLVSRSIPPIPVLNDKFIHNGTRYAIFRGSPSGRPIASQSGQLQCSSKQNAIDMKCFFPLESCTCKTVNNVKKCTCHSIEERLNFDNRELAIPLTMAGFKLSSNTTVEAHITDISSVQIQITLKNFSIITSTTSNECSVSSSSVSLTGCFNCYSGAKLSLICSTSKTHSKADLNCPSFSTIIDCDSTNSTTNYTVHFKAQFISETCTVKCPSNTITFDINGNLQYIETINSLDLNVKKIPSNMTIKSDFNIDLSILSGFPNPFAYISSLWYFFNLIFSWKTLFVLIIIASYIAYKTIMISTPMRLISSTHAKIY